jgi:predicted Fe-S protein YdhL (DUF1289 family)
MSVPIESPCIRVCVLDPITDQCIGCARFRREIAAWRGMAPEERRAVMAQLAERLREMTQRRVRGGRAGRRAPEEAGAAPSPTVTPDAASG